MYKRMFLVLIILLIASSTIYATNWQPINYSNPDSIKESGLTVEEFNNLTQSEWLELFNNKEKVNFAFSATNSNGEDITNEVNPNLKINVNGLDSTKTINFQDIEENKKSTNFNYDYSLSFNGDNSKVNFNPYSKINETTAYKKSIDIFFKTGGDVNSRQVIYGEGGSTNGINIYIKDELLYLGAYGDSYNWSFFSVNTPIAKNTPYRATFIYDGYEKSLSGYLNHKKIGEINDSSFDKLRHHNPLGLGYSRYGLDFHDGHYEGYYFSGEIYEIRHWHEKALTENEIINTPSKSLTGNEEDLSALWLVNENSSNTLYDQTSNKYNGEVNNATLLKH